MDYHKLSNSSTSYLVVLTLLIVGIGITTYLTFNQVVPYHSPDRNSTTMTYNVGDSIALDSYSSLIVEQVQISRDPVGTRPANGTDWINVQITASNSGQDGVIIGQYAKYLVDDNGTNYAYHDTDLTSKYSLVSNAQFDQPLQGPSTRTGWLGFEVPRHTTGLSLIIKPQQQSSKIIKVPLNLEVN